MCVIGLRKILLAVSKITAVTYFLLKTKICFMVLCRGCRQLQLDSMVGGDVCTSIAASILLLSQRVPRSSQRTSKFFIKFWGSMPLDSLIAIASFSLCTTFKMVLSLDGHGVAMHPPCKNPGAPVIIRNV